MLTEDELVKVWRSAEKLGWPYGAAFRMLILTSARREEIGQLRWSEIVGDTINLEGARTKNGEPHIIPVSTPALTLLDQSPRIADSDFVFTISGKSPLARWSGPKADLDDLAQIAPWRTHDLRRTTATGLQKLGVALQVTEAVLGHTAGSRTGVVGIYQRHDYATEKRAALEAWGAHVMALVEGAHRARWCQSGEARMFTGTKSICSVIEVRLLKGIVNKEDHARCTSYDTPSHRLGQTRSLQRVSIDLSAGGAAEQEPQCHRRRAPRSGARGLMSDGPKPAFDTSSRASGIARTSWATRRARLVITPKINGVCHHAPWL